MKFYSNSKELYNEVKVNPIKSREKFLLVNNIIKVRQKIKFGYYY